MLQGLPAMALIGGAAAFGAVCAALALTGAGVPFLLAALVAACCAGLLVYAAGRWALERAGAGPLAQGAALEARIQQLEDSGAHLRHDLRGVLSPALMMADRLLRNEDPAIRRAGQAVVRSVERATALLAENKGEAAPPAAPGGPDAGAPPPRSPVAGTGVPAP